MRDNLHRFFRAARGAGVRVSPAESIDAMRAVAKIGFADRQILRDTMLVTLAKTQEEKRALGDCFDLFFSQPEPPPPASADNDNADESGETGEGGQPGGGGGDGGEPSGGGDGAERQSAPAAANATWILAEPVRCVGEDAATVATPAKIPV